MDDQYALFYKIKFKEEKPVSEQITKTEDRKKGGDKKLLVLAVLAVAVLAGVIVCLVMTKEDGRNRVVTPDNVDEVMEEFEGRKVEQGYYTVTMDTTWHFETGDAVSENALVKNVETNTNDVYFDIFLAGDEENPIYESPVIPIGSTLEDIALDKPLDAGTHDCVVVYHLIDGEQNTVSTVRVALTIVVEK